MAFIMKASPKDEKLFQDINGTQENIVTLGRGSYTSTFNLPLHFGRMNILGGRFCSVANEIYFSMNSNHQMKGVSTYPLNFYSEKVFGLPPVYYVQKEITPQYCQCIFGHDVWIGRDVTIMGGVKIGNGAVIGTKAVVAKDIPPYAIAVGNPARVVKYRFDEETIRKFLAVKWWNWDLEKIAHSRSLMGDVEKFLEAYYSPELEEFPEDDFSRQLKTLTGGGVINLSPTFKQLSRCGLRSSKTSRKQSWKTPCLSFGSARTRPTRTPKL